MYSEGTALTTERSRISLRRIGTSADRRYSFALGKSMRVTPGAGVAVLSSCSGEESKMTVTV